jgi:hypothetical protein
MQSNAQQANQANFNSAQLRAQEVSDARAGLLGSGSAMRSGDFNAQNQYLQNRGANDQAQLGYENLGFNTRKSQLEGSMTGENTQMQAYNQGMDRSLNQAQKNAESSGATGFIGGIFRGMLSDERTKYDIEDANPYTADGKPPKPPGQAAPQPPGPQDATKADAGSSRDRVESVARAFAGKEGGTSHAKDNADLGVGLGGLLKSDERGKSGARDGKRSALLDFADKLEPKTFRYRHPEPGMEGRITGVMAQDMEKSQLGNGAVEETPAGKAIDMKKGLSLALASIAALKDEIDSLRGARGRKRG